MAEDLNANPAALTHAALGETAVEAAARIIANNSSATLGEAIKEIAKTHYIHPALSKAMLQLYGYTSDAEGIRHSLVESANIDDVDARFSLVTCSAIANFLIAKFV